MHFFLTDIIHPYGTVSTNKSIIIIERKKITRVTLYMNSIFTRFVFCYILDSPICSRKITTLPEFLTGIRRPINITCHMNNGNPTKLNFTWHLPNGHKRFGNYLNRTSNYITIKATNTTDFGQITCRAQNELGLFGECHFNMVLGG